MIRTLVPNPQAADGKTSDGASFTGVLNGALGSYYELSCQGYNSIGFHIVPPAGACIQFQGCFDGVFTPITLREIGGDGYAQHVHVAEDFVGSVATLSKLRFVTIIAGTGTGSVTGRLSSQVSTLEGIEHGYAPHSIGFPVVTRNIEFSGSVYNSPIWAAVPGKVPVVTDIHFTADATSTVTISDGPVGVNVNLFKGSIKISASDSKFFPINFGLPHVVTNGTVYFSQTASANVNGIIHGYEIDYGTPVV
jgi:hypothetical protein